MERKKKMRYLWFLLVMMLANVAQAMNCQELPDCASLGYSKAEDPNCVEDGYLNCPFDQDYKVCVQYNCEALGFTEDDKTSWCADLIKCKGNEKMTLCQKPCVATKYEDLKELAESGKCKLITMKNDITIPLNQSITLAENTIIDGGGHTLTSTGNLAYNLYYFANNTGFKNINIVHTQENMLNFYFSDSSTSSNQISLENVSMKLISTDSKNAGNYMFYKGTYNITGKFDLEDQSPKQVSVFSYSATKNFKDADVHILTTHGNSDIFSLGTLTMENSTVNIQSAATVFIGNNGQASFKNTKGTFHASNLGLGVIYGTEGLPHLVIQEGCDITLEADRQLVCCIENDQKIELSGTAEKPTKLTIIDASKTFHKLSVEAHDLNVTLVINGTSYKPTTPATTLLSEVDSSQNWTRVP